jgi:hypothetical protein
MISPIVFADATRAKQDFRFLNSGRQLSLPVIRESGRSDVEARGKGPAQPSPTLGDALNAGYLYLEVRCLGCDTHQTVALGVVRRPDCKNGGAG